MVPILLSKFALGSNFSEYEYKSLQMNLPKAQKKLEALDKMLGESKSKFCVGDTPTLPDFAIYAEYHDVNYLGDFNLSELQNLKSWVANCETLAGVKAVHGEGSVFKMDALPSIQAIFRGIDAKTKKVVKDREMLEKLNVLQEETYYRPDDILSKP
jgi:hypothetical protein